MTLCIFDGSNGISSSTGIGFYAELPRLFSLWLLAPTSPLGAGGIRIYCESLLMCGGGCIGYSIRVFGISGLSGIDWSTGGSSTKVFGRCTVFVAGALLVYCA